MLESLGSEIPLAARFFIAFLVVLALIALTAWLVRRFSANRLGGGATRGRQPRLAVIDAASVDGRRRLVLIRRDNIEHLLMIGGPTDVVVEQNIVRATNAGMRDNVREPARMPAAAEPLPRAVPGGDNNGWPLQPTVEAPPAAPAPRPTRSAPPAPNFSADMPSRIVPTEYPSAPSDHAEPAAPEPVVDPAVPPQTDRNLAEMAQRLEAALRRPTPAASAAPEPKIPAADPMSTPLPRVDEAARPVPPREPAAPKADLRPTAAGKTPFDSLEQEMANLLGRPTTKT